MLNANQLKNASGVSDQFWSIRSKVMTILNQSSRVLTSANIRYKISGGEVLSLSELKIVLSEINMAKPIPSNRVSSVILSLTSSEPSVHNQFGQQLK